MSLLRLLLRSVLNNWWSNKAAKIDQMAWSPCLQSAASRCHCRSTLVMFLFLFSCRRPVQRGCSASFHEVTNHKLPLNLSLRTKFSNLSWRSRVHVMNPVNSWKSFCHLLALVSFDIPAWSTAQLWCHACCTCFANTSYSGVETPFSQRV